jgi:hypothetical protein
MLESLLSVTLRRRESHSRCVHLLVFEFQSDSPSSGHLRSENQSSLLFQPLPKNHRLVLRRILLCRATWKTLQYSFHLRHNEIRNRISLSRRPIFSCISILKWREMYSMLCRGEIICSFISSNSIFESAAGLFTIAPPLQRIPNIHYQRPLNRFNGYILPRRSLLLDLKPSTIVLKQQRNGTSVGMRAQPPHLLLLDHIGADGWIVAQAELIFMPGVEFE